MTRSEFFRSANRLSSNQSSAFSCSYTDKPSPEIRAYHRIPDSSSRCCVLFLSSNCRGAISQGSLCHSLHIACFCSSSSLSSSPVMVRSSCDVLNSSTAPMVSLSFAPVSMCTTNSDNCLLQFSVQHLRRRPDSTDVPSSCGGEWDSWSVEHQSCKCAMLL